MNIRSPAAPFLAFGFAALPCAGIFFGAAVGRGWGIMIPCSAIAASITGGLLWRWLHRPHAKPTSIRGFWIGALAGLVSHPIAWYLALVWNYFFGEGGLASDQPLNPLQAIPGALVFTLWSIPLAGWLTIPLGGMVGYILQNLAVLAPNAKTSPSSKSEFLAEDQKARDPKAT